MSWADEPTLWRELATCFIEEGDEMFDRALALLLKTSKCAYGFLGYIDEAGDLVAPSLTHEVSPYHAPPGHIVRFPRARWSGLWGESLRARETRWKNEDLEVPMGHLKLKRAIAVPIFFAGELIGQLVLANAPLPFDARDAEQLEAVARYIAPILKAWLGRRAQQAAEVARRGELERQVKRRTHELEEALAERRAANERISNLINHINLGVLVEDETRHILFVNQAFCDQFSIPAPPEALIGADCSQSAEQSKHLMREPELFARRIEAILEARSLVTTELLEMADGRALERDYVPIFSDGRYRGHLWHYRDVTARVRAESLTLHAARMDTATTLAGGIAHDFNNLLTVLLGNLELLELEVEGAEVPEVLPLVKEAQGVVNQARGLSDQLLAYARGGRYHPQQLDLNEQVRQALQLHERLFPSSVQIISTLDAARACVWADPVQMVQLIANLCQNAVEAMPDGGRLELQTRERVLADDDPLMAQGLAPGAVVELRIIDSGEGMSAARLARAFEPFSSTKGRGRGLGLAAAFGIVSTHRGFIELESAPGEGTQVRVTLPASVGRIEAEPSPTARQPLKGDETILVADDEPGIRETLRRLLTRYGYTVLLAEDGHEAIKAAKAHEVDLTILDLFMPKLSGVDAFPALQAARPKMPIILCSGYERDTVAQGLLQRGAVDFVHKPFEARVIIQAIRKAFLDIEQ